MTQPSGQMTTLDALAGAARTGGRSLPPVHLWNPPHCGDIGMRIARDGTWFYQGSPIGRPALVRLFSTILRHDPDGHVLVTPVEKVSVDVEDAPFLAVEMLVSRSDHQQVLTFRTNVDDTVSVDAGHPVRFERGPSGGLKPYVLVRGDLWALATRPVFYQLVDIAEVREIDGVAMFGVASHDCFFSMARADSLEDLS